MRVRESRRPFNAIGETRVERGSSDELRWLDPLTARLCLCDWIKEAAKRQKGKAKDSKRGNSDENFGKWISERVSSKKKLFLAVALVEKIETFGAFLKNHRQHSTRFDCSLHRAQRKASPTRSLKIVTSARSALPPFTRVSLSLALSRALSLSPTLDPEVSKFGDLPGEDTVAR